LFRGCLYGEAEHRAAKVEAGIGSIKSRKYGFNRPAARWVDAMGVCGQRVLGFNLNKLINGLAERREMVWWDEIEQPTLAN
jgi:hypothetical protein